MYYRSSVVFGLVALTVWSVLGSLHGSSSQRMRSPFEPVRASGLADAVDRLPVAPEALDPALVGGAVPPAPVTTGGPTVIASRLSPQASVVLPSATSSLAQLD
ncbi:MAG: hypothetical protein AAF288_08720 [Planctomycetota bacterium]